MNNTTHRQNRSHRAYRIYEAALWLLTILALPCAAQPSASQPSPPLAQVSPAVAAVHEMSQAAGLLRQGDSGSQAQSHQSDALDHLRRLIEASRRQQQNPSQQSSQDSSSQQQASSGQQEGDPNSGQTDGQKKDDPSGKPGDQPGRQDGGGQQSSQGGSQAAQDSNLPGRQAAQGAATLPSTINQVEAWGFLPPEQRRELLQGMQAEPPARYRKLTERYWRTLNDAGQGRGDRRGQ